MSVSVILLGLAFALTVGSVVVYLRAEDNSYEKFKEAVKSLTGEVNRVERKLTETVTAHNALEGHYNTAVTQIADLHAKVAVLESALNKIDKRAIPKNLNITVPPIKVEPIKVDIITTTPRQASGKPLGPEAKKVLKETKKRIKEITQ